MRNTTQGMMKRLVTIIILAISAPGVAQTTLSSIIPGTSEGVTYFLPDTKVGITVETCCITQTPGEFNSYAERFLHIKDVVSKANNRWEITGIESHTEGVPNKAKTFTVKLGSSTASNIRLDEKGIICAIITGTQPKHPHSKDADHRDAKTKNDATQYMTEEMLTATSTAKMAELTAKEIYAICAQDICLRERITQAHPAKFLSITTVGLTMSFHPSVKALKLFPLL